MCIMGTSLRLGQPRELHRQLSRLLLLLLTPSGGMWLDAYTLDAMGQGVLFALPLLACSAASRTSFCRPFPVLREMHELQHDLLKHFTAGAQHS